MFIARKQSSHFKSIGQKVAGLLMVNLKYDINVIAGGRTRLLSHRSGSKIYSSSARPHPCMATRDLFNFFTPIAGAYSSTSYNNTYTWPWKKKTRAENNHWKKTTPLRRETPFQWGTPAPDIDIIVPLRECHNTKIKCKREKHRFNQKAMKR